jgi:hypothetical protein
MATRSPNNETTEVINTGNGVELPMTLEDGQGGTNLKARVDAVDDGKNRVYTNAWMANANDIEISGGVGTLMPPTTIWEDMNVASGGIARNTSLDIAAGRTVVYLASNPSKGGVIYGWLITLQNLSSGWRIYMKIDGMENFGTTGLLSDDLKGISIYNYSPSVPNFHMNLATEGDTVRFQANPGNPLEFKNTIELSVERIANPAKLFDAGLMNIYKAP